MTRKYLACIALGLFIALSGVSTGIAAPKEQAQSAGTRASNVLSVVQASEPRSLNPIDDLVKSSLAISSTIVEPLLGTSTSFKPTPLLALSWKRRNPTTWRFILRRGVKFTDGEPFNAAAAAFSVITVRDTPGTLTGYFHVIKSARAVSRYVLDVHTTVPTSLVPALMTFQWIFPPNYYNRVGEKGFGSSPVGTGPFVFAQWDPGRSISVTNNAAYWGKPPKLGGITWTWTADPQSRVAQVETGAAQLATALPPTVANSARGNADVRLVSVRSTRTALLGMNIFSPPLNDIRLRRAIWSAIDQSAIVKDIFGGQATLTRSTQSFVFGHFPPPKGEPTYNPTAARALVQELGNIPPIPLHWPKGNYPLGDQVVQAIAGMLQAVGIPVKLDPLETGAYFNLMLSNKMDGLYWVTNAPLYPDEDQLMEAYFRSGTAQFQYCHNAAMDKMIDRAVQEPNAAKRTADYVRINSYALSKMLCWMPLYDQRSFYVMSNRVTNLTLRPDEYVGFTRASVR